jgi:pyruvate ferredoxin oxidoreductase gamma subunit
MSDHEQRNVPGLPCDPFHVRIHGRGGQGVVTAAELLGLAAFFDGFEVQAFPSFGSERMGAPVVAFCRIASEPIRVREPVTHPDAIVILDATLLHHVDVFGGLADDGFVLVNSLHSAADLGIDTVTDRVGRDHVAIVPAGELARARTGSPRPNVVALGAFGALTGAVSLDALERAVLGRFGPDRQDNLLLVRAGFDAVAAVGSA